MDKISIDFIIFATFIFTVYSGFKRGFFKEFLIAIAYVPYMAAIFYIINEWIQGDYSFDSIIYKCSALGAFYIAYLFVIWGLSKALHFKFEAIDDSLIYIGKTFAGIISGARTLYFCLLCLIAFNLHLGQTNLTEKSKLATTVQPLAINIQNYLLDKGYINNEITIYDEAANGTFDQLGRYEHPLMKKIKNSDRFKEFEEKIDKSDIQRQVNQMIKRY